MYQTVFNLKQETPIIHFLHDQPGATLRATEVKPKLDRFITEDFGKIARPEFVAQYADTIRRLKKRMEDNQPSGYQIAINPPNEEPDYYYFDANFSKDEKETEPARLKENLRRPDLKVVVPSPFFANSDKRKDTKKGKTEKWEEIRLGVMYKGQIKVTLRSWEEDMFALVEAALPLLFCVENFGMRQSKGFGGFREMNTDERLLTTALKGKYTVARKKAFSGGISDFFVQIDKTYKNLRSNAATHESAIRDYYEEQADPVTWEKEKVTIEMLHQDDYEGEEEVRFVRAMLGLPGLIDYPQSREKVKVNITDPAQRDKIERFKSPITFKLYNGWIYLMANDVPKAMLDKAFLFYVGDNPDAPQRSTTISTPEQFNIRDFITQKLNGWQNV